ncbi:hypothetical protein H1S01_12585 [Heliobacterium chlorum]|uniref:Uncharacterized protein n=1 Tax=Heliobacterium chlorum TaxID=2698 RepID=A0ABR7T6Z4_HELCL|nr:hypothetical protein [Heliobacterium chlorum]MBC9785346.1 hypothetical protein [Heliobacterium chlorum]
MARRGSEGKAIQMILDAKYKNPVTVGTVKPAQSDVYQLIAYAVRYNCDNLFLVYPQFKDNVRWANPLASIPFDVEGRTMKLHVLNFDITMNDVHLLRERIIGDIGMALSEGNVNDCCTIT